jgi:hypothetical protein
MSPASKRFVRLSFILAAFTAVTLLGTGAPVVRAQNAKEKSDKPLYIEYKGVRIGMGADEVRKKLGEPKDKSDAQDFYMFNDTESAQFYYDKGKVMAVSVNYLDVKAAPLPKVVLGTDIEPKADGGMYKLIRYPDAGYWVSYNRSAGNDPLITVTMQKIQ